jgi:chromosome segregation ATPase
MWPFVFAWLVLLGVLAGFVQQVVGFDFARLPALVAAMPPNQQIMVGLIGVLAVYLVGSAIWQAARLSRQSRDLAALKTRLTGNQRATALADEAQQDFDRAVEHLVGSDPEVALASLTARVAEAEGRTATQAGRNAAVDMQERLEDIRRRQQALRAQLGEVAEKRRTIEPVFDELRERQIQLDKALTELETDANHGSLADRLGKLTQNVTTLGGRLKGLEESLSTLHRFKDELGATLTRLEPLRAPESGIEATIAVLRARHGELSAAFDAIETHNGEHLGSRVDALGRMRAEIEQRTTKLSECGALLESIRGSFDDLRARQIHLGEALTAIETDASGRSLVERQDELNEFVSQSRARLLTLENSLMLLNRFREDLDKYQVELKPLQSPVSGVEAVIADLHARRARLVAALDELDQDGDARLSGRVETIYRTKLETEQRIAQAVEQFGRLDTIRKDVDGLFAKLAFTVQKLGG